MRSDALARYASRGVTIVALLAAAYYWGFGGAYTPKSLADLEAEVARQSEHVANLHAEWDAVSARADSLTTNAWAIEREARERYGFIRDGEFLVRFVTRD